MTEEALKKAGFIKSDIDRIRAMIQDWTEFNNTRMETTPSTFRLPPEDFTAVRRLIVTALGKKLADLQNELEAL